MLGAGASEHLRKVCCIQLDSLNGLLHLLLQHKRERGKKSDGPGAFSALRGRLSFLDSKVK